MSPTAVKFIETDASSYVQDSLINNRKDTFVSSVILDSVRSRFLHAPFIPPLKRLAKSW
jgi:hypothetical protein